MGREVCGEHDLMAPCASLGWEACDTGWKTVQNMVMGGVSQKRKQNDVLGFSKRSSFSWPLFAFVGRSGAL